MNTRIWHLAGVSLLSLSMSAQGLADDNNPRDSNRGNANAAQQQQQQQQQIQQQQNQMQNQQRQQQQQQQVQQRQQQQQINVQQRQEQQQQNQQQRMEQQTLQRSSQQRDQQERQLQQQRQQTQQQDRQQQDRQQQQNQEQQQQQQRQIQERQMQERQSNLSIQPRPNETRQTQSPRQGYYQDIPRGNQNQAWRGNDHRPDMGHGNGWGSGPRYNPGYQTDRMPGGYSRVPYRGQDYYYSGGYWYRPQGPRYIVVEPPRGVRVRELPDYAQQVWLGSALFFLAAGTYYTYEQSTQEYVVAQPPANVEPVYSPPQGLPPQQQQQPQPLQQQGNPYDVAAYPDNGQGADQIQQDRYYCFNYAVAQSNFNPSTATYAPAPEVLGAYQNAMASCLVGRGYRVD